MMKGNMKRLLSMLLVLVMLFSLMPASAFAADNGLKSVSINSNVSPDYIKVFSADEPDTPILCPGTGVYELFPGRYLYTVEDVVGGYEAQGEFTVTGEAEQTVTINVAKAETTAIDGTSGSAGSGAGDNSSNSDVQPGVTAAPQDSSDGESKVTDKLTLSLIKEKEDEYTNLFANPYNAARYGYIDDVIEPRNTRFRIIRALAQLENKRLTNPAKKHGNIPL